MGELAVAAASATMTKQNVVPAEAVAAITVPGASVPIWSPMFAYPPLLALRKKCLSQRELGGCRIGLWVESMKASSTTHAKAAAALAASAPTDKYSAWTMRRPSALSKFEQIVSASKGKQIGMFLDYDGTLSPIVDDPDSAFMSDSMRRAVRNVATAFPTAIVSGRCLDKVINFVKLVEPFYAGSHSMYIKVPEKYLHNKTRVGALPPFSEPLEQNRAPTAWRQGLEAKLGGERRGLKVKLGGEVCRRGLEAKLGDKRRGLEVK